MTITNETSDAPSARGAHIGVSDHALARAAKRVGFLPRQAVVEEVAAALAEGRWAHRCPRFLIGPGQRRLRVPASQGDHRYAWPPCQSRAYVLLRKPGGWLVKTTIVPPGL